jgi:hypothetical protein
MQNTASKKVKYTSAAMQTFEIGFLRAKNRQPAPRLHEPALHANHV